VPDKQPPIRKRRKNMRSKRTMIVLCLVLLLGTTLAMAEYVPLKVKLNVLERLIVWGMLPKETSFVNWKIFNDMRDKLAPTEEELKAVNPQPGPDGGTIANWDAVPEKEITFGETTEKVIVETLKKMDKDEKLLPEHISLYKKFILRESE